MQDFRGIRRGDLVRHIATNGPAYVVLENYGTRVTAVACADLTNPVEWELVTPVKVPTDGYIPDLGSR